MLFEQVEEDFVPFEIFKLFDVEYVALVLVHSKRIRVRSDHARVQLQPVLHVDTLIDELVEPNVVQVCPNYNCILLPLLHRVKVLLRRIVDVELLHDLIDLVAFHAFLLLRSQRLDLMRLLHRLFQAIRLVRDLVERFELQLRQHLLDIQIVEVPREPVVELDLAKFVLRLRYVQDVQDLEDVFSDIDRDEVHRQEMLVEAVLVQLTVAAFRLETAALNVLAKGPRSKDFLAMRRASNLCLEDIQQLVAQVLLVEELHDQVRNVALGGPIGVSHQSHEESSNHLQQANLVSALDLVHQEVMKVKLKDPVDLAEEQVPLGELNLDIG